MQNFLWMLLLASLLSADEQKCTIQALSVKDKSLITDAFMQKVIETALPSEQKHIDGLYKVFVGEFSSYAEAVSALPMVRQKVGKDASASCNQEAYALDPQLKMQQAMLMAQARTLAKMKEEKEEVSEKTLTTVEPVTVSEPMKKVTSEKKETKRVVAVQKDVKTEALYCKPSKKALRESEIAEALAFYRHSSYYKFTD